MKGAIKIGKIAGIDIYLHWTFSILIAYITFIHYKEGQNLQQISWAIFFIVCVFVTVILHELGHAITAKKFKINTKDIIILPIGGLARFETIPEKPKEEFIVSFAGPAVNMLIALISSFFIPLNDINSLKMQLTSSVNGSNFMLNFFIVNVWLALFNLIPAFPMDGGRVLRAALSLFLNRRLATNIAARIGQALAVMFIIGGFFVNPFLVLIGFYIFLGAQAEEEYIFTNSILQKYKVKDAIMNSVQRLNSNDTIKSAIQLLFNSTDDNFLIYENDRYVGIITREEIINSLSSHAENEEIQNIMTKNIVFLDADEPLDNAYKQLQIRQPNVMPVLENNNLIGTLTVKNILDFLLIKDAEENRIKPAL